MFRLWRCKIDLDHKSWNKTEKKTLLILKKEENIRKTVNFKKWLKLFETKFLFHKLCFIRIKVMIWWIFDNLFFEKTYLTRTLFSPWFEVQRVLVFTTIECMEFCYILKTFWYIYHVLHHWTLNILLFLS